VADKAMLCRAASLSACRRDMRQSSECHNLRPWLCA
jgi:hypothetical protein